MALAATSQNGWPVIGAYGDSRLKALPHITGDVLAGDVWTVLDWLCRRFDAEVEAITRGDSWGYAPRTIIGSTVTSNHASGTAVDLNASRHPLGKTGTFSTAQVAAIRKIVADSNGVLRWGGDYSGRKDEMHFELQLQSNGNNPAKVAALAARVAATVPLSTVSTPAASGRPTIREGATGDAVKALQSGLKRVFPTYAGGLSVDGAFGPKTATAVREFQRRSGLTADGIVGPATWATLGKHGIR